MTDLAHASALYRLGLITTADYRQTLIRLYDEATDPRVMRAVRLRYVRLAVVS